MLVEQPIADLDTFRKQNADQKTEFRNYTNSTAQDRVSNFYHEHHKNQTVEYALRQKEKYGKLDKLEMGVWEAILMLNEVIDDSDPDTDSPQIVHLVQTAESIRRMWPGEEYDWFHLTGLIHDLGKVLNHPKFFNEPQWGVVGDTHPLGCQFSEGTIVFPEYLKENPDYYNPKYNTKYGIYQEGIGFDNVTFTWGHDEYLYQVCKQSNCKLPPQALYVIRYHSFYPFHNKSGYMHLASEEDKKLVYWVKEFQKHDLYSKLPEKPDLEKLLPYYRGLIDKYFPDKLKW